MLRLGRHWLGVAAIAAAAFAPGLLHAAGATPPVPRALFNDEANLVTAAQRDRLNAKLRRFADETSSQILVAVLPGLPEGEALEDFTVRTAQAWRAGQKGLDNGAILFVFVKDKKIRIEVGYGLEGALPDALAKRIIDEQIVPGFRAGDPAAGLSAGVEAMMAATRGEYTAKPRASRGTGPLVPVLIFCVILIVVLSLASRGGGGRMQGPRGRTYNHDGWDPGIFFPTGRGSGGGGSRSGGSWGGGSWGGGGGGGFSGGGGSFGGGGASGSW